MNADEWKLNNFLILASHPHKALEHDFLEIFFVNFPQDNTQQINMTGDLWNLLFNRCSEECQRVDKWIL